MLREPTEKRRIAQKGRVIMPRTKKQPEPSVNGAEVGDVLTLAEAAAYLKLSQDAIVAAVYSQDLPARLVNNEWRFWKGAIQQWLATGKPPVKSGKEALLAHAGSCKDDPDLEDIIEAAYRQRGRPITEDGSYRNFSK